MTTGKERYAPPLSASGHNAGGFADAEKSIAQIEKEHLLSGSRAVDAQMRLK
jgi:hypothetical protein